MKNLILPWRNKLQISKLLSGRTIVFVTFFFCILLTSRTVLRGDFFRPHDFTHGARIAEMNRSLQDGEFPVRWSRNFGFGYGMPLFNFYAPLPYYFAQIPYALGFGVIASIKWLYLWNAILSFVSLYFLGKELWGRRGGLLSAIFFSFSTYRALDLFVRGAIGEVYAMALLPLAFLGTVWIAKGKRGGVLMTSLSLAVALLSHNLIGMLSIGLVGVFGLFALGVQKESHPEKGVKLKRFGVLMLSVVLGITLSAFYSLPAFFEKQFTRVEETITTGDFDFHNHFVAKRQLLFDEWGYGGSIPGLEDGVSFALGLIPLILAMLGSGYVVLKGKKQEKITALFLIGCFGAVTFLTLPHSVWVWEQVPILKFIQFPWRFLTFSHIFLSLLVGASAVAVVHKSLLKWPLLFFALSFVLIQGRLFVPEKFYSGSDLDEFYLTTPEWIGGEISRTLNDYLPPEIKGSEYPELITNRLDLTQGEGEILVTTDKSNRLDALVTCQTSCQVKLNIFRFSGWNAWINGKDVALEKEEGIPVYRLSLPSGSHRVRIQLTNTPIRVIGNVSSLMTIGGLILIYGKRSFKH